MFLNKKQINIKKGFSSLELIVVVGIFGVLSMVVLFQFSSFSSIISLNNVAQDIALYVKKAQTDASSGRISGSASAVPSFGVYFDIDQNAGFTYFEDLGSKDGAFDNSVCSSPTNLSNECREEVLIQTGDRVNSVCVSNVIGGSSCAEQNNISITFTRPYLSARIIGANGSEFAYARISLISSKGSTRSITVTSIGQIEVQ